MGYLQSSDGTLSQKGWRIHRSLLLRWKKEMKKGKYFARDRKAAGCAAALNHQTPGEKTPTKKRKSKILLRPDVDPGKGERCRNSMVTPTYHQSTVLVLWRRFMHSPEGRSPPLGGPSFPKLRGEARGRRVPSRWVCNAASEIHLEWVYGFGKHLHWRYHK